jgi:CRISPR/Cas system-associated exonuclease Cas4 (RecB family)
MAMKLTPTGLLTYEECPRKYWYAVVARVQRLRTAANLVFGEIVHAVVASVLHPPQTLSGEDAVGLFDQQWRAATLEREIEYSATQTPDALAATGRALAVQVAERWHSWELLPLIDEQGEALIERRLQCQLAPGLTLSGKPDLVSMDAVGRVVILDVKTPVQACDSDFSEVADQLTAYQLLVEGNADGLGLSCVDQLGFVELIKRKVSTTGRGKGPEVLPPVLVERRPTATLAEYRQKALWAAEAIQRGRFPRRTGMAHNTPCVLCDYRRHCQFGETDGLVFPDTEPKAIANG